MIYLKKENLKGNNTGIDIGIPIFIIGTNGTYNIDVLKDGFIWVEGAKLLYLGLLFSGLLFELFVFGFILFVL